MANFQAGDAEDRVVGAPFLDGAMFTAVMLVGRRQEADDEAVPKTNGATPIPARVIQASGMVSVQASCTPDEALVLIQARARNTHVTLDQVATRVLDGTMRFGE